MKRKGMNLWQILTLSGCGLIAICLSCIAVGLIISSLSALQTPQAALEVARLPVTIVPTVTPIIEQLASTPTTEPTSTNLPTVAPLPILTDTPLPTMAATATPTQPAAIFLSGPAACIPASVQPETARVVSIVDGDTIHVDLNGQDYSVRYIGMDAPESTNQIETGGAESSAKNSELVAGQMITMFKDVSETDRYDRLLRYVMAGDLFVNYELVRRGYATAATYPPDVACSNTFTQAEQQARLEMIGLWAAAQVIPTIPPTIPPIIPTVPSRSGGGGGCDAAYPDVCIPSPPPDLDCGDISFRRFRVLSPDPHRFDGDHDGIGCEG